MNTNPSKHEIDAQHLISNLYHEIAQPLTALRGALDLALRKTLDPGSYAKAIQDSLEQHERLVSRINSARQIAEAFAPSVPSPCNLSTVLLDALADFEPVALDRGVTFLTSIETNIPNQGNEPKLRQLLFLVMDDLLDHCGVGEVKVEAFRGSAASTIHFKLPPLEQADRQQKTPILRCALLHSTNSNLTISHNQWAVTFPDRLGQNGSGL